MFTSGITTESGNETDGSGLMILGFCEAVEVIHGLARRACDTEGSLSCGFGPGPTGDKFGKDGVVDVEELHCDDVDTIAPFSCVYMGDSAGRDGVVRLLWLCSSCLLYTSPRPRDS